MRRMLLLVGITLLLALVGASIMALMPQKPGLPSGADAALRDYLAYKRAVHSQSLTLRLYDRAARPERFTAEVSHASFGDSVYYSTDYGYDLAATQRADPTAEWSKTEENYLPFPPRKVWCVLLEGDPGLGQSGAGDRTTVVFVARHEDLYTADYIVHEGAPDQTASQEEAILSRLRCQLEVDSPAP